MAKHYFLQADTIKRLNEDIHSVAIVYNGIMVNTKENHSYNGICIWDFSLTKIINQTHLYDGILQWDMYVKPGGKEVLFYDIESDRGPLFTHVDLVTETVSFIDIPARWAENILGHEYLWQGDRIQIKGYEGYGELNLKDKTYVYRAQKDDSYYGIPSLVKEDVDKKISQEMQASYHNDYYRDGVLLAVSERFMEAVADKRYRVAAKGEFLAADIVKKDDGFLMVLIESICGDSIITTYKLPGNRTNCLCALTNAKMDDVIKSDRSYELNEISFLKSLRRSFFRETIEEYRDCILLKSANLRNLDWEYIVQEYGNRTLFELEHNEIYLEYYIKVKNIQRKIQIGRYVLRYYKNKLKRLFPNEKICVILSIQADGVQDVKLNFCKIRENEFEQCIYSQAEDVNNFKDEYIEILADV